jgi:hypothetical protein
MRVYEITEVMPICELLISALRKTDNYKYSAREQCTRNKTVAGISNNEYLKRKGYWFVKCKCKYAVGILEYHKRLKALVRITSRAFFSLLAPSRYGLNPPEAASYTSVCNLSHDFIPF